MTMICSENSLTFSRNTGTQPSDISFLNCTIKGGRSIEQADTGSVRVAVVGGCRVCLRQVHQVLTVQS